MRLPLNLDGLRVPAGAPYYGWVLVGALGITETISWGATTGAFSLALPLQPHQAPIVQG
jgi:hypothetical protein